jgi:molybdenum cofactor cytidylyltransferase
VNIVGLLLAAGSAKRFGSDKLLHPLQHGVPIAVQAARHLKKEIPNVVAALRPGSEKLAELLRAEGCEVTLCANADEGMGASLACATRSQAAHGLRPLTSALGADTRSESRGLSSIA